MVLKAIRAEQYAKKAEEISDYSTAAKEYEKILSLFPDSDEHRARLAVCYMKKGDKLNAYYIKKRYSLQKKFQQKYIMN